MENTRSADQDVRYDVLKRELRGMPRWKLGKLLREVERERREKFDAEEEALRPLSSGMSRDDYALRIARQQYEWDLGVMRVLYFPTGAPEKEIRLLTCGGLIPTPKDSAAHSFRIEVEPEVDFKVYVADVDPDGLAAVLDGRSPLPEGWILAGHRDLTPVAS